MRKIGVCGSKRNLNAQIRKTGPHESGARKKLYKKVGK